MAGNETIAISETYFGNDCPIPLQVLDFINDFNATNLDVIWPCSVRSYWINIQPFVQLVRNLLAYVTPFIIVLGVTLNIVSFSMLSTLILCDSGLSLYLRALAISDNGALIFNYAVGVARSHLSNVNALFMNSQFLCGLSSISMEFFQFTSTWLVVALTWARVGAIMFPLQSRQKNNNRSAVVTIIILACTSFVVSLTKLFSGGYESDSVFEFIPCQKVATPWGSTMYIYIAFSTWLPSLFISIGNILLIIHMRKSDVIRIQLTGTFRRKANIITRTSKTLITVSIVYLILLLPIGVVETLELYWDVILIKYPSKNPDENKEYVSWLQEKMLLKWCRGFFFHVYHWNFAINFFLYYLTGQKFRDRVITALKNGKKSVCSIIVATSKQCSLCTQFSSRNFSPAQASNILLIRVISIGEQNICNNNNITR